ncbi:MAG: hypothetical protein WCG87_02675 [Bacteroidota bacterium]
MNTRTLFYILYATSGIALVMGSIISLYIDKEIGKWVIFSGGGLYIISKLIRWRFLKKSV